MGRRLHLLKPDAGFDFPPLETATPEGLLAVGGDLHPERLLAAYRRGIFPWYSQGQPILWWSPDPRAVLLPEQLNVSRSLRKTLRAGKFHVTFDRCFRDVMLACAEPRRTGMYKCRERQDAESDRHEHSYGGTWITPDMVEGYSVLHERGFAHSVEVWRHTGTYECRDKHDSRDEGGATPRTEEVGGVGNKPPGATAASDVPVSGVGLPGGGSRGTCASCTSPGAVAEDAESGREDELVGGLYGVALGGAFFGESMFARATDASKVAFVRLVRQLTRWGFTLIDCQQYTAHLARFGAREVPRAEFVRRLSAALALPGRSGPWQFEVGFTDGE